MDITKAFIKKTKSEGGIIMKILTLSVKNNRSTIKTKNGEFDY